MSASSTLPQISPQPVIIQNMTGIVVKNLDNGEKSWTFLDGSERTVVILDSVFIGRGKYLPGWRWSELVGKETGKSSEAHIGYVISGRMCTRTADGQEVSVGPGEAFEVQPGHDAWVIGDEPCIALDLGYLDSKT